MMIIREEKLNVTTIVTGRPTGKDLVRCVHVGGPSVMESNSGGFMRKWGENGQVQKGTGAPAVSRCASSGELVLSLLDLQPPKVVS